MQRNPLLVACRLRAAGVHMPDNAQIDIELRPSYTRPTRQATSIRDNSGFVCAHTSHNALRHTVPAARHTYHQSRQPIGCPRPRKKSSTAGSRGANYCRTPPMAQSSRRLELDSTFASPCISPGGKPRPRCRSVVLGGTSPACPPPPPPPAQAALKHVTAERRRQLEEHVK